MANENYPRQENSLSEGEINHRIVQGSGFAGTVISSLQDGPPSGPFTPDIIQNLRFPVSYDTVGGTQTRIRQHSTLQESENPPVQRPLNLPSEQSTQEEVPTVNITVRKRQIPLENASRFSHLSEEEIESQLRGHRASVVREYVDMTDPSLQRLLELCALLLNMDVDIERKYIELDIWRVFEANTEKSHFLHLTQGLGILEKYASNLIKENRPPYWRNVKFTSSLVQLHVGRLIGSRDILSQMGYTQDIADGVAFPGRVAAPDVTRVTDLAADLFFARFEIDTLLVNKHPFYEMYPPVPLEEVELPRLFQATFPPSLPQPFPPRTSRPAYPITATTESAVNPVARPSQPPPASAGYPSSRLPPTPSPRRQGRREPNPLEEKQKDLVTVEEQQEHQHVAERNTESEGDSEYEDAEDGIAPASGSFHTWVSTDFDCRICGESIATKFCKECKDTFCVPCDSLYHKHASRQHHVRTSLVTGTVSPSTDQPASSTPATFGPNAAAPSTPSAAAAVPVQQNQRAALSGAAANAGAEARPTAKPRPVPAPRRNIRQPPSANQGIPQGAKTPEPKEEERQPPLPPKPVRFTPQAQQTASTRQPLQHAGSQQLASQPVVTTASQIQDQRRPILRPPAMPPSLGTTQQSSQVGRDEKDNNMSTEEVPPPLPPRQPSATKPKVPVESRAPLNVAPTIPEEGRAMSCPNCYCLNSAGAKTCLFCKKPLPEKSHSEPVSHLESPQRQGSVEVRNFPSPIWVAQDPGRTGSQASESTMSGSRPVISSSDADPDKWQCEYCTFLNKRARAICEMCCKTRTTPLPPKKVEPLRNQVEKAVPPRSVTNMAMQTNSQQIPAVNEQTRKPEPANLQTAQPGTPVIPPAAPPLGNTFPAEGHTWQSANRAAPFSPGPFTPAPFAPAGPPLRSPIPGVTGTGQGGVMNQSGMVSPGFNPPFPRDTGMPYGPHGFPAPPPMIDPMGMTGPASEINAVPSFPPAGNLPYNVGTGFASTPPFAAWNSPPVDDTFRRQQEEIYVAGARYVEWLKQAETEGFTVEEVNIASILGIEDRQGPIHWLQTAWYDLIHRVMVELSVPENSQEIGNISTEEVREALIDCTGEVSRAVNKCVENRKKKVRELQKAGVYAKTDCISALDTSEGDTEKAILELEKIAMRPMLQRVLNSCLPDSATHDDVFRALTGQVDNQSPQDRANFEAIVKDRGQDMDRRIRAVFAEKDVSSWGKAEIVIKLIDRGFAVDDCLEAARSCREFKTCLNFLEQECPLCFDKRPMTQMITFLHCQDRVCQDCVSQYITVTIKDKNIMHLVCPICRKPENLDDEAVATEYFNNFDIMIRGLVDRETHDLFQRKLRDRTLMKEPNFRWCSHCSSGFINERPDQIRMMCPHCQQYTCFKCKRKWEDQHEGITCEQFTAWKEANDPDFQAAGLAAHLKRNGIECPNCKFRYDLSKGGCMHFKCATCSHEFCSGCYNPFIHSERQNCPVSEQCTVLGLHAHHPRDCYFYLRDLQPEELQKLLRDNNVDYNTDPPEGQGNADDEGPAGAAAAVAPLVCKVNEQKESVDGLVDAECGREVQAGHAGLCKKHYVEYLVVLVNDHLLDPADIMSSDDLGHVLRRGFKEKPPKPHRMRDNEYHQLLLQTVKDELPLPPKPPRKRVLDDEQEIPIGQNIVDDEEEQEEDFPLDDEDFPWALRADVEPAVLYEDVNQPGSIG